MTRPPCSSRTGALSLVCLRPHGRHHPSKLSPSTQLPARSLALRPLCRGGPPRSRCPPSRFPDPLVIAQLQLVLGSLPCPSQSPGWCSQAPRGRTVARLPASARLCPGRFRSPVFNRSTRRAPQLTTAPVCSADHPCSMPSRRFCRPLCDPSPLPIARWRSPAARQPARDLKAFFRVSVRAPTFSVPKCRSRGSLGLSSLCRLRVVPVCRRNRAQSCSIPRGSQGASE